MPRAGVTAMGLTPVSYTHLDVYKRQTLWDDTAPKAKDSTVILVAMAQQDLSNSALSNAVAKAFAVLEKKPQDATALNILSEVAYQDGDLEKCISFAQFADDYAGNLVLMNRPRWADALCLLGRDGEAEPILRSIVQVMPCLLYTSRCV